MTRPGDKAKHRSLDDRLGDIRDDAALVVRNTDGKTYEEFEADVVLQDHVVRRIANTGEAAKYIGQFYPAFQEQVKYIPWSDLARTRDVLNHSYFGVDPRLVWAMARKNMPDVLARVTTVINNRTQGRAAQAGFSNDGSMK